jgi:hypothetical protein
MENCPKANDQKELILGNKYNVLCVRARFFNHNKEFLLPTFGTEHIDGPEVPSNTQGQNHIHVDYRFCTIEEIITMDKLNISIQTSVLVDNNSGFQWQTRIYARIWNILTHPQETLQDKYRFCKLINNICPHQGINLATIPPMLVNERKQVICPGHSLRWNCDDNKLNTEEIKNIRPIWKDI